MSQLFCIFSLNNDCFLRVSQEMRSLANVAFYDIQYSITQ